MQSTIAVSGQTYPLSRLPAFPKPSRSVAIDLCPLAAGHDSGVRPQLSLTSISTFPKSSRSLTTGSCPPAAAHNSGVRPLSSLESISTFPESRRSLTIDLCPFSADIANAAPIPLEPASSAFLVVYLGHREQPI